MTSKSRHTERVFSVVIPAAGLSRRMGCPKLLLPWGNSTILQTLVSELIQCEVNSVVVVLRKDDKDLRMALSELDVISVTPEVDPPDMRMSVELGLRSLEADWSCDGGWFLIPADHPLVSASTVKALLDQWQPGVPQILIPTFAGTRGHPTLFSWNFASEIQHIPPNQGVNWLVRKSADVLREIPVEDSGVTADLDTPEDYARLKAGIQKRG